MNWLAFIPIVISILEQVPEVASSVENVVNGVHAVSPMSDEHRAQIDEAIAKAKAQSQT